jgi:O-antigen ligase
MATVAAIMAGMAFIDQNTLKRNAKIGIIILGLATIYLTKSRTPLVAVTASICVIYLVKNSAKFGFYSVLMAIGAAILVGMVNYRDIAGQYLTRTGRAEELTTLTSRTEIWGFVLAEWNKSPLLGYGYGSTKTLLLNQFYLWDFTTESAHNLFIQCLFTLGLVGATVLFLIMMLQARQISTARSRQGIFLTAYVYFMGITEASFAGPGIGLVTLCWLIGGSLLQADSKPETLIDIDSDPPGSG